MAQTYGEQGVREGRNIGYRVPGLKEAKLNDVESTQWN
jgi:hypothetical protein